MLSNSYNAAFNSSEGVSLYEFQEFDNNYQLHLYCNINAYLPLHILCSVLMTVSYDFYIYILTT